MTVYARGYRPYEGATTHRRQVLTRFLPIFREGYRDATRGVMYWILKAYILLVFVVAGLLLYFQAGPLRDLTRGLMGATPRDATEVDAIVMREGLGMMLHGFHDFAAWAVVLLSLFVGAGLIADDLRTRALPIYLSRPVTPFDYLLGKLLVPVVVIFVNVVGPGLGLIVLASLMRPSEESLRFFADQRDYVAALFQHGGVVALSHASLVLFVSTVAKRRVTAIVIGAIAFLGGPILLLFGQALQGPLGDALRACSLPAGGFRILSDGIGGRGAEYYGPGLPPLGAALVAAGLVLTACAVAVLRRARTTEVVA